MQRVEHYFTMKSLKSFRTLLLAVGLWVCFVFVGVPQFQSSYSQNHWTPRERDAARVGGGSRGQTAGRVTTSASIQTYSIWQRFQGIVLAVVACGDHRLAESLVVIKSAIVFTKSPMKFIVFADDHLLPRFREKLNEWHNIVNNSFSYELHHITFPVKGDTSEWRRFYKPCACQRLFLPTVLRHIDALLYVDTDTLFLGPLEDVWRQFELMNSSQIVTLSPDYEDPNMGNYNRFPRVPYYGKVGVNSGVMLMNLTRMRTFRWTDYAVKIYKRYKPRLNYGDQDIINIIFHFHPDKLYLSPCRYNYRNIHCASWCHSADKEGAAILHPTGGLFHSERLPVFHAIYTAMEEYELGTDPHTNLYIPIKIYLEHAPSSYCGKVKHVFTKSLDRYFQKINVR